MRAAIVATVVAVAAPAWAQAQAPAPAPTPAPAPVPGPAPAPAPVDDAALVEQALAEVAADETIEIQETPPPPGSHAEVSRAELERAEHDDIHHVLGHIAGVYLREEDGYGLRPNIGMRGAAAERSAKVALMEDGVLIAPAPYSAPAAYYFPLVTRMSRIEVLKGPAAVVHGPNTVGGAIDLIGEPMPAARAGYLDTAVGSDRYGKLHARAAERGERWGAMAEYVKLRTDGFKEIDGGGDSGFDKDDVQLWGRVSSPRAARVYHQLDAKIGYGEETSDETYTGLSDSDFAARPQRRYAATQLDQMNWDHWRFRLAHRLELGGDLVLETTAYRHVLDRAWGKVDAFVGDRDLFGILASPEAGSNPIYYAVLTGASDSTSPEDELILGTNDRRFVSQGVQSVLKAHVELGGLGHDVDAGVRLHHDRADRRRFEDGYRMVAGALVRSERPRELVLDTDASTIAGAFHLQDAVQLGRLRVTAGARLELIRGSFTDQRAAMPTAVDDPYAVVIPGGGVEYALTPELSLLSGLHRGFVPVAPSAQPGVRPESSVNVEGGARWRSARARADLVGFLSEYGNLKGTCTLSSGCAADMDGDEFNGGQARVWGLEAQAATEVALPRALRVPLAAAYTLTRSEFHQAFESDFAAWGDVEAGDEMPYLPRHQLALSAALAGPRGEVGAAARWHGVARDVAGQGPIATGEKVDALVTLDLSGHLALASWAELYATCDNLLDEQAIVSRRPYGARPNAPRRVTVGYKARF
jgi:Fe(3+) dicitrate transport protein